MRRLRLLAVLGVAVAVAGCEFDLTPIEVRARAHFSVSVQAPGIGGPTHLRAFFHPGSVSPGRSRPVRDDSIRVNGVTFAPHRITANGTRLYEIPGLAPSAAPIRIQPPAIADLREPPPEITVYRMEVVAPDTLVAAATGQIEITISGVDRIPSQGRTGLWDLHVHPDACDRSGAVVSLSGDAPPPPFLIVPVSLLPPDLRSGHLIATGQAGYEAISPGGYYEVHVTSAYSACIPFRVIG